MLTRLLDVLCPSPSIVSDWSDVPFQVALEDEYALRSRGVVSLDSLLSTIDYHDSVTIQRAIRFLKYKRMHQLSARLGQSIVQACLPYLHYDQVLCPVPLHFKRQFTRGYNQSTLLCRYIADATGLPQKHLLRRTKDTGHQAHRTRYERLIAMHDAFAMRRVRTLPRHVVLIDDIATTCATLDACAHILKCSGVQRVDAWVVARA